MGKAENKTQPIELTVESFVAAVPDTRRRDGAEQVDTAMRRVTAQKPRMWGPSIIGFGQYLYRYASGREGDICRIPFSPRKAKLVIYLFGNFGDRQEEADALFASPGRHSTSVSCLYIKNLVEGDLEVLERLVALNWDVMNARYPS